MSRIIKFRYYNEDLKEMVYSDTHGLYDFFGNVSEELMQFTGLHDKNGKEIYEFDIVAEEETVMSDVGEDKTDYIEKRIDNYFKYMGGTIGERRYGRQIQKVEWKDESCGFEPFSDSEGNCGHCGGGIYPNGVEVIGNIYENPELISKDKQS